jgi:hypothetical protein
MPMRALDAENWPEIEMHSANRIRPKIQRHKFSCRAVASTSNEFSDTGPALRRLEGK